MPHQTAWNTLRNRRNRMTRDEAVKKFNECVVGGFADMMVDGLAKVGLLHLETTEDKVRMEAISTLTLSHTFALTPSMATEQTAKLTRSGAIETIDRLLKSGFRITKE